jgi:hypothetical protein
MLDEGKLERMQPVLVRQPLDGGDLASLVLHRERKARQDPLAVDQHRAGAARALIAPLLGAVEMERLAQQVEQRHARVGREVGLGAVDAYRPACASHGNSSGRKSFRREWT